MILTVLLLVTYELFKFLLIQMIFKQQISDVLYIQMLYRMQQM